MRFFPIAAASAVFCAGAFPPALAQDVPAQRKESRPPAYPASCHPPHDAENAYDSVTVAYAVTEKGLPVSVRVRESTNDCFNDTAIAAVRSWTFEPRTVDGKKTAQEDVETTFVFNLNEETQAEDFDARPLKRVPPRYPEKCMRNAEPKESILVEFDVNPQGRTENITIADSSYDCLNSAAIESVKKWEYEPARRKKDGEPVMRRGVQTVITFELIYESDIAPEERIRPLVRRNFVRIQSKIKDGDYLGALEKLAEIEGRFSDTFTPAESGTFHQLRGVARLGLKDYAGALDDLRMAETKLLPYETGEAIQMTIAQLEKVVAAQEAQAAQQAAGKGSAPAEPATGDGG